MPLFSGFISWFKFCINGVKVLDGNGALLVSGAFSMPISTKGDKRPICRLLQPSKAAMYISLCAWWFTYLYLFQPFCWHSTFLEYAETSFTPSRSEKSGGFWESNPGSLWLHFPHSLPQSRFFVSSVRQDALRI